MSGQIASKLFRPEGTGGIWGIKPAIELAREFIGFQLVLNFPNFITYAVHTSKPALSYCLFN
jgi:hypothetical protein